MSARQVELVIRRTGHPERRMVLPTGGLVVGRAEDNDVVLSEIGVSRRHARIAVEGDAVVVEDMGSGNGTFHNGKRVARQLMGDGDEIVIDPFTLAFYITGGEHTAEVTAGRESTVIMGGTPALPAILRLTSAHRMARPEVEIPPGSTLTLGRSEKADVVLPEPAASRLHAEVGETAGSYWIRDRGSANGTWVNGVRVKEKVLADKDRVRIGSVELEFDARLPVLPEDGSDHTEAFDAVMFTQAVVPPPPDVARLSRPSDTPRPGFASAETARAAFPGPEPARPTPEGRALAAAPTVIPPPPVLPTPSRATPSPTRDVPPPPVLPFAPKGPSPSAPPPRAAPLGARPAPATLPPAPPPPLPAPTPGVELDFDVSKVKARKGPKGRGRAKSNGFFSRPINQISLGILFLAFLMVGGKMTVDLASAILTPTRTDPKAAPVGTVPVATAPLTTAPVATTPVATTPVAATPVAATPVATTPVATPAPTAPVATPPVATTPSSVAATSPATTTPPATTPVATPARPTPTTPPPAAAPIVPTPRANLDPARREEVAALIADGMRLFTEGKQFEAATQFYKVQQLDPGNPDAERMGYVACEFIAMDRIATALAARSASETQRSEARKVALDAVAAATSSAQILDAQQKLAAALAMLPDDAELLAARDQLAQRQAQLSRGIAQNQEKKKLASLSELVAQGQREMDRGNLSRAVSAWEQVLQADPSRASPQYYQAEEGIRSAKDQMKANSKKSYAAGIAAYNNGDLLTARTQLAQTVATDPYNDAAASRLSEVRKRLKEQASEVYKEARVLEDINQVSKALALYQKVLTYVDDAGDPLAQKAQSRMNALMQ